MIQCTRLGYRELMQEVDRLRASRSVGGRPRGPADAKGKL
jgi:hypothetical protein